MTRNEPSAPSISGSAERPLRAGSSATPCPRRNSTIHTQVPVRSGVKRTFQQLPAVALVSAASPSAAKKPGTTSSAFEIAADPRLRVAARYAQKDALMSGWMLGEKLINGKAALLEADLGKGKVVMFAFRPQHRGQTFGTFPLVFNALEK